MALVAVFVFALAAQAATLTVINRSASEIHAIYISSSNTNSWEENIIDGYRLPSGNKLDIRINGSYRQFDIRVEDEEGNYEEYTKFPGNTREITLFGDGDSEYR